MKIKVRLRLWVLGGAYFLAKVQTAGAYSGGAYKRIFDLF